MLLLSSTSEKSLVFFPLESSRVIQSFKRFFFFSNKTIMKVRAKSFFFFFQKTKINLCTTKNTTSRRIFFPDISNKFSIKKSIKNLFQNSEKNEREIGPLSIIFRAQTLVLIFLKTPTSAFSSFFLVRIEALTKIYNIIIQHGKNSLTLACFAHKCNTIPLTHNFLKNVLLDIQLYRKE